MSPPSSDPAAASSDAGLPALERLRTRIESAVAEIERLRTENAALAERVHQLADEAAAREDDALALTLDSDPDALREKVETFIEAIDQMLAEPSASGDDAGTAPDSEPSSESVG